MQHHWKLGLVALLLAGGAFTASRYFSASGPYAGNWKVTVLQPGTETTICIVKIGGDESRATVDVVDVGGAGSAEAEDVRSAGGALHFRLKTGRGSYAIAVYPPKPGSPADRLLGSFRDRGAYEALRLDKTTQDTIDSAKAETPMPGFADLRRALDEPDSKDKLSGVQAVLKKHPDQAVSRLALLMLLQQKVNAGAPADELKSAAEKYLDASAAYGREIELQAADQLARGLSRLPADRVGSLALEFARRAEKLLGKDDPPPLVADVYKTLARTLRAAGKNDEAKEADEHLAAINARLDEEFAKNEIKFQPERPNGRRAGDRVVLTELFTGTQCPPCVAADVAFDAALQAYRPTQAVFLEYHEHIPGPDPLTCPASEARMSYYDKEIQGTPTFIVDGKLLNENVGGPASRGETSYGLLHAGLDKAMGVQPGARLKLTARRQGETVELSAEVSELSRPGERTHLRFVLAEEVVHYAAPNGQRLHHHVVRDFPGGAAGTPLKEKSVKQTAKVDLTQLRKQLESYLAGAGKRMPFADDERPLELRQLKAVAFVQDDATKEVLQAAQADVPGVE